MNRCERAYYPSPSLLKRERYSKYLALTLLVVGIVSVLNEYLRSDGRKGNLKVFAIVSGALLFLSTFYRAPSQVESEADFRQREARVVEAALVPLDRKPAFPQFDPVLIDQVFKTDRYIVRKSQTDVRALPVYPAVVIKRPRNRAEVGVYLQREEKARHICEEYKLKRLYVPHSQVIDAKTVAQEKLTLFRKYEVSEGVYLWGCSHDDPRIQNHFKEIFIELLIFVTKSGLLGAVKYDNIELTEDLRVGLFDLDNEGKYQGTVELLKMVPKKWLGEMFKEAIRFLGDETYLNKKLPEIEEEVAKRDARAQLVIPFRNKIQSPNQLIRFNPSDFATQNERYYAKHLIAYINEALSKLEVPFKESRIVYIDVAQSYSPLIAFLGGKRWRDHEPLELVLKQLKAKGYVADCDTSNPNYWKIYC